ncbi:hypothetical protein [Edaphobacter aggregans]|uniref:hypothetical protein n=1 Tax=Edaphobacter aggregans TaxID=570835 RepID=UPI00055281DC|nr:hypothetical protein [Edaphobacter aggregans]
MITKQFALLCLLTYALPVLAASDKPVPDGQKSYKEFRATIKSFPFSASAERKKQIGENYPSLRVGMTKKQVAALIGNPDYSELDFGPKGPGEHWLGSHWMYALFVREDSVNEKDPNIEIFFGTGDLVSWVVPSGLSGLSEIGECCKRSR